MQERFAVVIYLDDLDRDPLLLLAVLEETMRSSFKKVNEEVLLLKEQAITAVWIREDEPQKEV